MIINKILKTKMLRFNNTYLYKYHKYILYIHTYMYININSHEYWCELSQAYKHRWYIGI